MPYHTYRVKALDNFILDHRRSMTIRAALHFAEEMTQYLDEGQWIGIASTPVTGKVKLPDQGHAYYPVTPETNFRENDPPDAQAATFAYDCMVFALRAAAKLNADGFDRLSAALIEKSSVMPKTITAALELLDAVIEEQEAIVEHRKKEDEDAAGAGEKKE